MTNLQDKRLGEYERHVARLSTDRDRLIAQLIRTDARWQRAKKDLARYTKRLASLPASAEKPQPVTAAAQPERPAVTLPAPATPADDGIPDFLRRETAAAVDALAVVAIQAQKAERERTRKANAAGRRKAVAAERMMPKQKLAESIRRGGLPT